MIKILFISINSIHMKRWFENLKDSSYQIYWFDLKNMGYMKDLKHINQYSDWKQRKINYIKGEYFLRKRIPSIYIKLQPLLEKTIQEKLEEIIKEIKPDMVHSLEMQSCSYPILKTMLKYHNLKWIYSCWGSDLFYYKDFKNHKNKIIEVLQRVNYLHTDCMRDYQIANDLGFKGKFLGVIPGGSGFKLTELENLKRPQSERKIILVKGNENKFGRAINVLKALELLGNKIKNYRVVIFGAHEIVKKHVKSNNLCCEILGRDQLNHNQILELMGEAKIYIGNSISDGIPNTLLEAVVMDTFPIQSNPGGATTEIIKDGINGLIIKNPNDVNEIVEVIQRAIKMDRDNKINYSEIINNKIIKDKLDYFVNKIKIVSLYEKVYNSQ